MGNIGGLFKSRTSPALVRLGAGLKMSVSFAGVRSRSLVSHEMTAVLGGMVQYEYISHVVR